MNEKGSRYSSRSADGFIHGTCLCVSNWYHGKEVDTIGKNKLVAGYPKFLNIRKDEPLFRKGVTYGFRYSDGGNRVLLFISTLCIDNDKFSDVWQFLGGFTITDFKIKFKKQADGNVSKNKL